MIYQLKYISYIKKNYDHLKSNVVGGYNLTCIGDDRMHSCMFTKYSNTISDKALRSAYKILRIKYKKHSFLKRGSDERQFNSPGVDLPIASIFRTKYGEYPEYHTSLDDFKLVTIQGLYGGLKVVLKAIEMILSQIYPKNLILCEPHMSKRKLYPTISKKNTNYFSDHIMDFLQYADGKNSLNEISIFIGKNIKLTKRICDFLLKKKIIEI